jgi:uncharacterized protein
VILPDVNVLLYAFRCDAERHDDYRSWLDTLVNGEAAYGISPQVLASVIRIGTHRRIYVRPSSTPEAVAYCDAILQPEHCTVVQPGPRHWGLNPGAEVDSNRCLGGCPFLALSVHQRAANASKRRHKALFPPVDRRVVGSNPT